mgnify:CR=1 FL=1
MTFHPGFCANSIHQSTNGSVLVTTFCSRILLNFTLEISTHQRLLEDKALECLEIFSKYIGKSETEYEKEVSRNGTFILSLLCNSNHVIGHLTEYKLFDVFCEHMLYSQNSSEILFLSQIFLNVALHPSRGTFLVSRPYFEPMLNAFALSSNDLKANCVKIIKLLFENDTSKVSEAKKMTGLLLTNSHEKKRLLCTIARWQ